MLNFITLQSNYPELKMWGASAGKLTFVICKDEDDFEFTAVAKTVGVEGGRDLGEFETFEGAKLACEYFLQEKGIKP